MTSEELFNAAVVQHQAGNAGEAEQLYRRVLAEAPGHAPSLHHLGLLMQATGRQGEAVDWLRQAVTSMPSDATLHNSLANLLREIGKPDEAVAAYEAALRLRPDYVNAQYNFASLLLDRGDMAGAAHWLGRVVEANPSDAEALSELGIALKEIGRLDEAADCFQRAASLAPENPLAHYNLGNVLQLQSRLDMALQEFRRAAALQPNFAQAHNNIGMVLKAQGWIEEAIESFEHATRINPRHALAHLNLASAYCEASRFEEAVTSSRVALELDPGDANAHAGLGTALMGLEQWASAEAAFRGALERSPDEIGALVGLGVSLLNLTRGAEAERTFERVLDLDPDHAGARSELGSALEQQRRLTEAIAAYRAVPALDPAYAVAQNNLGNCLQKQGRHDIAIAAFERALSARPSYAETHSNILLCSNYLADADERAISERHRAWAKRHAGHLGRDATFDAVDRDRNRRLRVGYLSPDFRFHSVAYFFDAIVAHHHRETVHVTCYSNVARPDAYTERLRGLSDRWRDIRGLEPERVAELIAADGIDILVDLAGHTGDNRLLVMARRPAPVQMTYLGYPNTTGLEQIDYRITDAWADPGADADYRHTESLIRIPSGFLCYRPWSKDTSVTPPPVLEAGHVTFGSFNNIAKLNPLVVETWARILGALPGSRLLLKSPDLADEGARRLLVRRFEATGIDAARLELIGGSIPRSEHLTSYARVDIGLDPFPYNGTTTTCEAMWMGVPVVTLAGDAHRGRVGASILHQVDLSELVAHDAERYVALAIELARDPQRLGEMRAGLRPRMASSLLLDAERTVGDFEQAYRTAWTAFCESPPPPRVDPASDGRVRLHIGGLEPKPGWQILNIMPGPNVDYVGDCQDLGQFSDASIDEIYASHIIEHLGHRDELGPALRGIYRVLKPGGILRVSVPDLEFLSRELLNPHYHVHMRLRVLRMIFGGQLNEFDFHKVGFTFELMHWQMTQIGFRDIARVEQFELFDDASRARLGNEYLSLNVEARK